MKHEFTGRVMVSSDGHSFQEAVGFVGPLKAPHIEKVGEVFKTKKGELTTDAQQSNFEDLASHALNVLARHI
ncbi:MAG: hypothetical protein ACTHWH_09210, partial [Marinobacter sp.]